MTLLNIQIQEHSFFLREKTTAIEDSRSMTMVYKYNTCQMEYGLCQTNSMLKTTKWMLNPPKLYYTLWLPSGKLLGRPTPLDSILLVNLTCCHWHIYIYVIDIYIYVILYVIIHKPLS